MHEEFGAALPSALSSMHLYPIDGAVHRVSQDATGSRTLAYGTAYDFGTAGAPTLTTTPSKVDILGFEYVASISKWCYLGSGLGF